MAESRENSSRFPFSAVIVGALAIAALHFARQILLPVALSALLSFLLTPLVNRFERFGLGRVVSVVMSILGVFVLLSVLGWVLLNQVVSLSDELPEYRSNLIAKVRSLRAAGGNLKEVTKTIEDVSKEFTDKAHGSVQEQPKSAESSQQGPPENLRQSRPVSRSDSESAREEAVEVKVVQMPPSPLTQIQDWLGPLVAPLTTGGIVIVLAIFILLQREDIRDRIIQLFGTGNLHTTTEAITDAASRVSGYLRMNLLINACYGIGVAAGLYFIGLPNAILWGTMGMLLRFLPYLGPWIAASMPILLSLAVFDRWSATLLVLGLFLVLELLVNNVLEPLLYGNTVGVSSLGIILAAIFWTWLWGPVGLVLAVPLTVCLVVTGNYVPQLRFFTVLFSDRSTLSFSEKLYQRLLARDTAESGRLVLRFAEENGVEELFDQVMIPAMELAERDRHNGILSEECAEFVTETMEDLIDEALSQFRKRNSESDPVAPDAPVQVICIPAVDDADETAAMMLAELLRLHGVSAELGSADSLTSEHADRISSLKPDVVAISLLPPIQRRNGRYLLKRLRANHPNLPIVIGLWQSGEIPTPLKQFSNDPATYLVGKLSSAVPQIRTLLSQQRSLAVDGVNRRPPG